MVLRVSALCSSVRTFEDNDLLTGEVEICGDSDCCTPCCTHCCTKGDCEYVGEGPDPGLQGNRGLCSFLKIVKYLQLVHVLHKNTLG
jgi:hypothetical protein